MRAAGRKSVSSPLFFGPRVISGFLTAGVRIAASCALEAERQLDSAALEQADHILDSNTPTQPHQLTKTRVLHLWPCVSGYRSGWEQTIRQAMPPNEACSSYSDREVSSQFSSDLTIPPPSLGEGVFAVDGGVEGAGFGGEGGEWRWAGVVLGRRDGGGARWGRGYLGEAGVGDGWALYTTAGRWRCECGRNGSGGGWLPDVRRGSACCRAGGRVAPGELCRPGPRVCWGVIGRVARRAPGKRWTKPGVRTRRLAGLIAGMLVDVGRATSCA